MKKLIMIKYAELTTKKDNRNFFINTLSKNIDSALFNIDHEIIKDYFRMFISVKEDKIDETLKRLSNVFGIHEVVLTYFSNDKEVEVITSLVSNLIKENTTFKVETNRSDKSFPIHSMDLSRIMGSHILKNYKNMSVDVHKPSLLINIEIRREGVYVFTNGIKGKGGYPTGTLGKALLMLSGGIDSIVAGYQTMKRGVKIDFIYFESLPHTSLEARQKVIDLAKILKQYGNTGRLFVVPFTSIQENIYKNMDNTYMITIMRRMMYRIATRIAIKNKNLAIINGESIGQVASQTLSSIGVVNEVTSYPIIRPLASFDKLEIIDISKQIGAYEISILPFEDCCTIFVPPHPVINPNLTHAKEEEQKMDFNLLNEAIRNTFVIKLKDEEKDDLL